MLISAVYASVHINRILIQRESGSSVAIRGGFTRTVSMMKTLM